MSKSKDIDKQLDSRKNDLMKTDCAVVIAGETSAGKSSVINLIIGEDILPTDTLPTTSRICRLRYSEKFKISTIDSEHRQIHVTEFDDKEKMTDKLADLSTTNDSKIKYINVWLPLEILKGNVVIVDTPGIGDQDQEKVAGMMMDYLPNALAFVFVVNMANAGGLQKDRLMRILKRVRESLNQMHSFDPKDTLFLLNKWDSLVLKNRKTDLFEEMKKRVHKIWDEVHDKNILKFSAARVVEEDEVYQREFKHFRQIFKSIIAKNENKRIKVHIEFIRSFIKDCDVVVARKLESARQNTEENEKTFDGFTRELYDTERVRNEVSVHLQQNIDKFLGEMTRALHEYIISQEFKLLIQQDLDKAAKFKIGGKMDLHFKEATRCWLKTNMACMFERRVMKEITEKVTNTHQLLHNIKNKLNELTSSFDLKTKVSSVLLSFAPRAVVVTGVSMLVRAIFQPPVAIGIAAVGIAGGIGFKLLENRGSVINSEYVARIERLTTTEIRKCLASHYSKDLEIIVENVLKKDLKEEIDNLEDTVASMKTKVDDFRKDESTLISLSSAISKIRNRLKEMENTDIQMYSNLEDKLDLVNV